jgi:hypothetical protein
MICNHPFFFVSLPPGNRTKLHDSAIAIWVPFQEFIVMVGDFDLSFYDFKYCSMVNAYEVDI